MLPVKSKLALASLAMIAILIGVSASPSLFSPSLSSGVAFAQNDKGATEKGAVQEKAAPKKDAQKKAVQKIEPKKSDTQNKDSQKRTAQKNEPPKATPQTAQRQSPQATPQAVQKQPPKVAPQAAQKQPSQAAPQTSQKQPSQVVAPQTSQKQASQKKDPPKEDPKNKEVLKKDAPKKEAPVKEVTKQNPRDILARTPFTLDEQAVAAIPGIPDARVWGDSETEFKRVLPTVSGPWLAISGGGADGAFGAGLLVGWTQSGNRPAFAVVTGSSLGALIGPYAFLGSEFYADLTKNFTYITASDVFEDKPTPESFLDTWPLKRMVEKRVTRNLLK